MPLTPDQLEHWPEFLDAPHAEPGQTEEQAVNGAISAFQYWCMLDGIGIPSEADVRAHMRRPSRDDPPRSGDA